MTAEGCIRGVEELLLLLKHHQKIEPQIPAKLYLQRGLIVGELATANKKNEKRIRLRISIQLFYE